MNLVPAYQDSEEEEEEKIQSDSSNSRSNQSPPTTTARFAVDRGKEKIRTNSFPVKRRKLPRLNDDLSADTNSKVEVSGAPIIKGEWLCHVFVEVPHLPLLDPILKEAISKCQSHLLSQRESHSVSNETTPQSKLQSRSNNQVDSDHDSQLNSKTSKSRTSTPAVSTSSAIPALSSDSESPRLIAATSMESQSGQPLAFHSIFDSGSSLKALDLELEDDEARREDSDSSSLIPVTSASTVKRDEKHNSKTISKVETRNQEKEGEDTTEEDSNRPHISLSRPILILASEKQRFWDQISGAVKQNGAKRFDVSFSNFTHLVNDYKNREFLAVEVGMGWKELKLLTRTISSALSASFHSKPYYAEERFHSSLGFVSIPNQSSSPTNDASPFPLEAISRELEISLGSKLREFQGFRAWRIGARIGKEVRWFELEV